MEQKGTIAAGESHRIQLEFEQGQLGQVVEWTCGGTCSLARCSCLVHCARVRTCVLRVSLGREVAWQPCVRRWFTTDKDLSFEVVFAPYVGAESLPGTRDDGAPAASLRLAFVSRLPAPG
jgi:hypothetical protein|eukprot:COSAG01_NODE_16077_length_1272_cov_1.982097_2_plen_120_part_00